MPLGRLIRHFAVVPKFASESARDSLTTRNITRLESSTSWRVTSSSIT